MIDLLPKTGPDEVRVFRGLGMSTIDDGGPGYYIPVGGEAHPVKPIDLMVSWVGLTIAGAVVAVIFVIRLRKAR